MRGASSETGVSQGLVKTAGTARRAGGFVGRRRREMQGLSTIPGGAGDRVRFWAASLRIRPSEDGFEQWKETLSALKGLRANEL